MGKARSGAQVKKLLVLIERVCLVSGSAYPAGNFAVEFSTVSLPDFCHGICVSPLAEEHFTVPCALALTALYIHAREIFPRACFGCCQVAIVVGLPLALWLYYRHRPKPSLYDHTRDDRLENPIMSHRHHP